ncbi:MAG TPA: MaoC family dehydratase [Bacillota bacterium]|nr:MaoC family dehydratase [Bacillota bacterium]
MDLGRTYDQLNIGDKSSFRKTITETDVVMFAGLTGDFNPIHIDAIYASHEPFGRRIAHGMLTLSLLTNVLGNKFPGLGTVLLDVQCRFKAPVYIGDTIEVQLTVIEKLDARGWVRMDARFTNQDGKEVISGSTLAMPPAAPVALTKSS